MDTTAAAELLMAGGTAPSDHGRPPFWVDAADRHPSWEEDQGEPLHSPALAHNFNRYDGFGVDAGGRGTSGGGRGLGPSGPGPPLKRMRANHMGLGIEGLEQGYQGPPGGYGREGIGGGYGEGVSEVNGLHGGIGPRGPVGMPTGIGMQQRTSNGMQGGGQGFGPGSFSPGPGQPDASPLGGGARIGGAAGGGSGSGVANTGGGRGRGMGSIFFKTKLCCRFRAGNCPYNTNCNFAHGMEELRKPPRGWEEMVANQEAGCTPSYQIQGQGMGQGGQGQVSNQLGQQSDAQKFHKTRPCKKYFSDGGCPYGDRCNFLHDEPGTQARSVRETSALSSGPLSPGGASSGSGGVTARPPNWKTRLCNKWEVTGHCPFGEKCHFAHGTAELQSYGGGPFDSSNGGSGGGTPTEVKSSTKQWEVGLTDPQPTGTSTLQGLALKQARCGARLVHAAAAHHRADAQWKESWSEISTVYGDWIEDDQIKLWNEAEKVYSQKISEYAGQELPARRDKGDGGQYYGPESDPYLRADTGQNCIPQRRLNGQHIGYHGVMAGVHSLHSQNQVDYGYYGQEGSNYDGP